jgi:hypothetical protein
MALTNGRSRVSWLGIRPPQRASSYGVRINEASARSWTPEATLPCGVQNIASRQRRREPITDKSCTPLVSPTRDFAARSEHSIDSHVDSHFGELRRFRAVNDGRKH